MTAIKKEKTLRELTEELLISEERIHESEKLFRSIFCLNPIPMSLTDLKGNLVIVNDALAEMVGYQEEEIKNKNIDDLGIYDSKEAREKIIKEVMISKKCVKNVPIIFIEKNGNITHCLLFVKMVIFKGIPHILEIILVKEGMRVEKG